MVCKWFGFFRVEDLPKDIEQLSSNGSKIKFVRNELIENCRESKNIALHAICGPAKVIKAHENETLNDIQQHKKYPMAYICRYKLVRETIYKLVPVSWQPGEEELRHTADFSDFDEQNMYTDTDDQSETVLNLCDEINQLHTSLTATAGSPLVSPFKIVKNSVQKVARNQSSKKRSSPDPTLDDHSVSPSKRNKLINDSNYGLESPTTRNSKILSPAPHQLNKAKKNLNDSFTVTNDDESQSPMFTSKINEEEPMKMRILRERNENKTNDYVTLRSNLRNPDSAKSK